MLEFGLNPIARAMTVFALCAMAPIVDIVQGVAGITAFRGFLIFRIQVATVAGNVFMLSQKRELGNVMIKVELLPGFRTMAFAALLA